MGPAETTGIVIITVAIIQGLLKLTEHLINKHADVADELKDDKILSVLSVQSQQLKDLHDSHSRVDADGIPLWYVPRSWMEAQKQIVDRLQKITETEYKMLGIIERLERRLDNRQD